MTVLIVTPRYYERAPTQAPVRSPGRGRAAPGRSAPVADMAGRPWPARSPGTLGPKRLRVSPVCGKAADYGHFHAGEALAVGLESEPSLGLACSGGGLGRTRRQAHVGLIVVLTSLRVSAAALGSPAGLSARRWTGDWMRRITCHWTSAGAGSPGGPSPSAGARRFWAVSYSRGLPRPGSPRRGRRWPTGPFRW